MSWRKWNKIIHRDLGYLCFGLTVIYAISGIAVNHIDDWNPNYRINRTAHQIQPFEPDGGADQIAAQVLSQLDIDQPYNNTFRSSPTDIEIYLDGTTVFANYQSGEVEIETIKNRHGLRQTNFLHLNEPKRLWTFVADLYAVALATLAISGLFIIKGRKGITGRGAWLTTIGVLIPLFFLWLYF